MAYVLDLMQLIFLEDEISEASIQAGGKAWEYKDTGFCQPYWARNVDGDFGAQLRLMADPHLLHSLGAPERF